MHGELTAHERWMVKSNIDHAREEGLDVIVARLNAGGYNRVATALERVYTGRHASPQAWRRLRETMTPGELADIALDIFVIAGGDSKQIERALTEVDWNARKQL